MGAGSWFRAARRARSLSQRELAELADLPLSTVARIEAGHTTPRLDTFVKVLAVTGYELVVVDRHGRMLRLDAEHDRLRDRGDRRFPAHLPAARTPGYFEGAGWWGWERIAWPYSGEWVPEFTFWRRNRWPAPVLGEPGADHAGEYAVWADAT